MKFQNPSLNFFLNGRKDERTHARTHKPKPICSPLFQSWVHNKPMYYKHLATHFFVSKMSFSRECISLLFYESIRFRVFIRKMSNQLGHLQNQDPSSISDTETRCVKISCQETE